jgi:periplasmic protein TonB
MRIKFVILFILSSLFAVSQNDEAITNPDVMPEYPGGAENMMKFISSNMKALDQIPKDSGYVGCKCMVEFTIGKDGKVKNVFIVRSCINCSACDGEAIRAIEKMPVWKPGLKDNKPVDVKMGLPLFFYPKK